MVTFRIALFGNIKRVAFGEPFRTAIVSGGGGNSQIAGISCFDIPVVPGTRSAAFIQAKWTGTVRGEREKTREVVERYLSDFSILWTEDPDSEPERS